MTYHHVVDDALQPGDDVLQHGRPGQPPNGRTDGPFDDGAVKLLCRLSRSLGPVHINAGAHETISLYTLCAALPTVPSPSTSAEFNSAIPPAQHPVGERPVDAPSPMSQYQCE